MSRNEPRNPVALDPLFGQRLRDLQETRGLKNEDAARELEVGLRLYQMWRRGQRPGMKNLVRLARFYEVSVGSLLGEEEQAA